MSRAVAHANIALAKYWGKADQGKNLPAVPSLSLTLDALRTRTRTNFDPSLADDEVTLDGRPAREKERKRVVAMLDVIRGMAKIATKARVESENSFPTAAGLASSASGFAALALSATHAAGLEVAPSALSALARAASVSAARSLWGGFVVLPARAEHAEPLVPGSHFPMAMTVALTRAGEKAVGSTEGMIRTALTSPYYAGWLEMAPRLYEQIRQAVLDRDLATLGRAVEASALAMHASMFAADPPIVYFSPVTLSVMERVRELRASGVPAFFTMDAGPHVKVVSEPARAEEVASALAAVPGVLEVIRCKAGPDAFIEGDAAPSSPVRGVSS
jgi:diphosphomevalonate decarboxylase